MRFPLEIILFGKPCPTLYNQKIRLELISKFRSKENSNNTSWAHTWWQEVFPSCRIFWASKFADILHYLTYFSNVIDFFLEKLVSDFCLPIRCLERRKRWLVLSTTRNFRADWIHLQINRNVIFVSTFFTIYDEFSFVIYCHSFYKCSLQFASLFSWTE